MISGTSPLIAEVARIGIGVRMNRAIAFFLTTAVLFTAFSDIIAEADEIKLKNDQTFIGKITKEVVDGLWMEISTGAEIFLHISQIKSVKKSPVEYKKDIEDRKDIKAPVQITEAKKDAQVKPQEIADYLKKIKEITEKDTRAKIDYDTNAKMAVEGLSNNEINLEELVYIVQIEDKKRLRIEVKLLDELKSVKPVPPRFEKTHALLIESVEEEIKARVSGIAGDKEAVRQHNLRASDCAKQAVKEMESPIIT